MRIIRRMAELFTSERRVAEREPVDVGQERVEAAISYIEAVLGAFLTGDSDVVEKADPGFIEFHRAAMTIPSKK